MFSCPLDGCRNLRPRWGRGKWEPLTRGLRRRPRATGWDPAGVQVSYNEGMRKRRWWFAALALALLAACVGVFLGPGLFVPNQFATVPDTRDARLVGTWSGVWPFMSKPTWTITLRADGTARSSSWGPPIQWGTRDGVLHTKFRSSGEGYVYRSHPYVLSSGGRVVEFKGNSLVVTDRMKLLHR